MEYDKLVEEPTSVSKSSNIDFTQIDDFQIRGNVSKHDKLGIGDENIKIRQNIARAVFSNGENALQDLDLLKQALKALSDNDKAIIAQARLTVDEEANNANVDLVNAIVNSIVDSVDNNRNNLVSEVGEKRDVDFNLPEPDKDILEEELVTGNGTLSENEILEKLK